MKNADRVTNISNNINIIFIIATTNNNKKSILFFLDLPNETKTTSLSSYRENINSSKETENTQKQNTSKIMFYVLLVEIERCAKIME